MSSSSSYGSSRNVLCGCGIRAKLRTAWTEDNPGRRFYGCQYWKVGGGGCGFFYWEDPPLCSRELKSLIIELHRDVVMQEQQLTRLKTVQEEELTRLKSVQEEELIRLKNVQAEELTRLKIV